jgi:hypothetical protein
MPTIAQKIEGSAPGTIITRTKKDGTKVKMMVKVHGKDSKKAGQKYLGIVSPSAVKKYGKKARVSPAKNASAKKNSPVKKARKSPAKKATGGKKAVVRKPFAARLALKKEGENIMKGKKMYVVKVHKAGSKHEGKKYVSAPKKAAGGKSPKKEAPPKRIAAKATAAKKGADMDMQKPTKAEALKMGRVGSYYAPYGYRKAVKNGDNKGKRYWCKNKPSTSKKKAGAKKSPAKKAGAKKSPAKKAAVVPCTDLELSKVGKKRLEAALATKPAAKKAKKSPTKKSPAKKSPAKKAAPKKATPKKGKLASFKKRLNAKSVGDSIVNMAGRRCKVAAKSTGVKYAKCSPKNKK